MLTGGTKLQDEIQLIARDGSLVPISAAAIQGYIPDVPTPDIEEFRRTNPQYDHIHIPPTGEGQPIDLLIGSDTWMQILQPDMILAIDADTLLLPTKFGSLIVRKQRQQLQQVCNSAIFTFSNNPLQTISDLDLVGLVGLTQNDIDEEERAIQQFYASVTFDNKRYSINWPWKVYPPQLSSNFGLALGRLRSLHRQLQKSPQLLQDYDAVIQKQLADGIIEKVENLHPDTPVLHYLPHHPVLQPEKTTTMRQVYDASSKTSKSERSLNDNIRKGTKGLTDMVATLLRFRRFGNVITSDIAKAFHQIGINESDRDAARFIWLKDPLREPVQSNLQGYRFTRVAFGITASPFLLYAVIQYHTRNYVGHKNVELLTKNLYADNLVLSIQDNVESKQFYLDAKEFFHSMSMNLTQWNTNIPQLSEFIPEDDKSLHEEPLILGIRWRKRPDTISIKKPTTNFAAHPTPRTVAKDMAIHFDPLGWMAPILLLPKMFFRKVWDRYKAWDVKLNEEEILEWNQIVYQLKQIPTVEIPRMYSTLEKVSKRQIHTFVDTSAAAYAVVVYLRTITESGASQTSIVAAKARLTPKKKVSIPKLEFIALLLGIRFTDYIKKSLQFPEESTTHIWSDSKCAIAWMQQNKILPPLIEKYVCEAKHYDITTIQYVPSTKNYADIASRGADVNQLQRIKWWNGPEWIDDEKLWPSNDEQTLTPLMPVLTFTEDLTCKTEIISETEIQGVATIDITAFSTLAVLLRRTAFCLKALVKFRKNNFLQLQQDIDTQVALQWWIYWDQKRVYAMKNEPEAGKVFPLRNMKVFRDENSILRCHTRIANSVHEIDTVNPILLVKKSTLTTLLVLDIHTKNMHSGTSHTLASLRKQFWLPHARREIYTILHSKCQICKRYQAEPYANPPPAPLPEFRVTRCNQPFQAVGVDICGPFFVRKATIKTKKWVILFTCAVVRAVHMEVLDEMTSQEILFAFRKFFARRGVPKQIVSDNAPQFRVLDGCFKNIWKDLANHQEISTYFANYQINWKFIPEISPWMGGMYERLIKILKGALEKTYANVILTNKQFEVTILEIEGIMNSRPIAYVERENSHILTPNDFLMAHHTAVPIQFEKRNNEESLEKLWKSSQAQLDAFWNIWSSDYLMLLRDRNDQLRGQRRTASKTPEKGDIVVMIDLNKKRCNWKTAVVERLITSQDGNVRSAQIRVPNRGRLIRPIVSLAPLHLTMDLPDVSDDQLSADRTAIIHSLPEDAAQRQEEEEQTSTPNHE